MLYSVYDFDNNNLIDRKAVTFNCLTTAAYKKVSMMIYHVWTVCGRSGSINTSSRL